MENTEYVLRLALEAIAVSMVLHVIHCCLGYELFERRQSAVHVSFLAKVNHVGDKWLTFRKPTTQRQCSVTISLRALFMMGRRSKMVRW